MYISVCIPLLFRAFLVLGWGCKQERYSSPSNSRTESFEVYFGRGDVVCLFFQAKLGKQIFERQASWHLHKNL